MDLEILKIASDNNNNRIIQDHTHRSKLKNHLCGDEIQIKMIIKSDKIIKFGYEGKSCVYCQAAANLLSKISLNKKKSKINELCDDAALFFESNKDIIKKKWKFMGKIFKSENKFRKECILLPFKAVKKIVSD